MKVWFEGSSPFIGIYMKECECHLNIKYPGLTSPGRAIQIFDHTEKVWKLLCVSENTYQKMMQSMSEEIKIQKQDVVDVLRSINPPFTLITSGHGLRESVIQVRCDKSDFNIEVENPHIRITCACLGPPFSKDKISETCNLQDLPEKLTHLTKTHICEFWPG